MSPRQAINVWFECHGAPRDSENELPPKRPPKELKELMRASSVPGSLVLLAPSTRSVVVRGCGIVLVHTGGNHSRRPTLLL